MAGKCGEWQRSVKNDREVWRCQGSVENDREVWRMAGKCGEWQRSVKNDREVWRWQGSVENGRGGWRMAGKCGEWQGSVENGSDWQTDPPCLCVRAATRTRRVSSPSGAIAITIVALLDSVRCCGCRCGAGRVLAVAMAVVDVVVVQVVGTILGRPASLWVIQRNVSFFFFLPLSQLSY